MARYLAGTTTRKGVYLSVWPPDISFVSADDEPLPGIDGATYRRLPALLVVALSPLLGALFVIGFPFVIVAAIAYAIFQPLYARLTKHAGEKAYLLRGDYALAASALDGKAGNKGTEGAEVLRDDGELDELRAEVEAEREEKRTQE